MQCNGEDFCDCDGSCMPWKALCNRPQVGGDPYVVSPLKTVYRGVLLTVLAVVILGALSLRGCGSHTPTSAPRYAGRLTAPHDA